MNLLIYFFTDLQERISASLLKKITIIIRQHDCTSKLIVVFPEIPIFKIASVILRSNGSVNNLLI